MKKLYRTLRRYFRDLKLSKNHPIKLFNCQQYNFSNYTAPADIDIEKNWLYRFIQHKDYFSNSNKTISIFGINGDKLAITLNKSQYKIFYTIENVHVEQSPWHGYKDLLIKDKRINLSLGFDYIDYYKYVRFPFWLMTKFEPTDNYENIKEKCKGLNSHKIENTRQDKFCSFICRNDYFGDRKFFWEQISKIQKISCPSRFMHNDDDLKTVFKDNKLLYLKQFKFNLCPENSNYKGYVTEKLFDAISSECIPIYWGSENNPEPDILNQNRILFLNLEVENTEVLNKIKILNENEDAYQEFLNQPIFTKNAPEIIYGYFQRLESKLKEILK